MIEDAIIIVHQVVEKLQKSEGDLPSLRTLTIPLSCEVTGQAKHVTQPD